MALQPSPLAVGDSSGYYLYTPELHLLAETEISTSPTKAIAYSYLWFGDIPVASVETATNTTSWYATDHLGTPLIQTNSSGAVVWRAEHAPYGDILTFRTGATLHQPLRLPGQVAQDGIEAYYNVFRWYRSGWGRYTQADPMAELRAAEPNLYLYARARPVALTDSLGLWAVDKSCDSCPGGYSFGGRTKVQADAGTACAFMKKPKCASLIQNLQFGATMDNTGVQPLGSCMRRLCEGDHKIFCAQNTDRRRPGACAKANPGGALTLMRGKGTGDCYFDQGGGWSHTIFHEMVHVCGLTQEGSESYETGPYSKLYQKIMWTCAGVPY